MASAGQPAYIKYGSENSEYGTSKFYSWMEEVAGSKPVPRLDIHSSFTPSFQLAPPGSGTATSWHA